MDETTPKLAAALAKAQGDFPVIPKDKEVEVKKDNRLLYTYKYAELTTIIACTRPSMSKNGLSFTQGMVEGGFATKIMHDSGEVLITGFIPFDFPKNADMKTVAGLVTYVKRISLTAALGVSADEDVDAAHNEGASGNTTDKRDLKGGAEKKQSAPPVQTAPSTTPPNSTPANFNAPKAPPPVLPEGESYVIPSGTQKGKKLRQFELIALQEMLFKLEAVENKSHDVKEFIRNVHIVVDTRMRRERESKK